MTMNDDAFSALLDSTFTVELPSTNGKVSLECRHVPFYTVTRVLSLLASTLQSEFERTREDMVDALQALVPSTAEEKLDVMQMFKSSEFRSKLLTVLSPVLRAALSSTPDALDAVLTNVIVGVTQSQAESLSVIDGMAVLTAAFERMDKALLADQVGRIFFGLSQMIASEVITPKVSEGKKPATSDVDSQTNEDGDKDATD